MTKGDHLVNRRRCLFGLTAGAAAAGPLPLFAQSLDAVLNPVAGNAEEVFAAFSGEAPSDYPAFVKQTYDGDLLVRFRLESVDLEVFLFRLADETAIRAFIDDELERPNVVQVGANQLFETQADDTFSLRARSLQYALDLTRIDQIADSNGGAGVRIAVIDSAVDRTHPALDGNVIASFDIIGVRPDVRPMRRLEAMRHGTAVAGVIAATGKLKGVAPNAELIAIEAFTPPGEKKRSNVSSSATIAHSIDAAIKLDCDIINMSFGGPQDSLIELMIEEALSRNIFVVAASGNKSANKKAPFPASHKDVLAVTAVDRNGDISEDAIIGAHTRIAAPGVDILTTAPKGGFQVVSGTSLSAPHVAGLAALAKSRTSSLTPGDLNALLYETGDPVRQAPVGMPIRVINGARLMNRIA